MRKICAKYAGYALKICAKYALIRKNAKERPSDSHIKMDEKREQFIKKGHQAFIIVGKYVAFSRKNGPKWAEMSQSEPK